jgi:hypothetical protein
MASVAEYAYRYLDMQVPLDPFEGSQTVRVNKYRNAKVNIPNSVYVEKDLMLAQLKADARELKFNLLVHMGARYYDPLLFSSIAPPEVMAVYSGKGLPSQVQLVLRHAYPRLKKTGCAMLQDYCNNFIGLDCNGFVAAFVRERVNPAHPQGASIDYFADHGKPRKNLEDIQEGDVAVAPGRVHILVIGAVRPSGSPDTLDCDLAQSRSPGLGGLQVAAHTLSVDKANKGRFTIDKDYSGWLIVDMA